MITVVQERPSWHGWHWISPLMEGCGRKFLLRRLKIQPRPTSRGVVDGRSTGWILHAATGQLLEDGLGATPELGAVLDLAGAHVGANPETLAAVSRVLAAYRSHYSIQPRAEILATEYRAEPKAQSCNLGAIYDHIVRYGDRVFIREKKFEARRIWESQTYWKRNGQILLQALTWGGPETQKFGKLAGIELDLTDTRGRCDFRLVEIPIDTIWNIIRPGGWFRRSLAIAIEAAHAIEAGTHVPYAAPVCTLGHYPCEYVDLCSGGIQAWNQYQFEDGTSVADKYDGTVPPWEIE